MIEREYPPDWFVRGYKIATKQTPPNGPGYYRCIIARSSRRLCATEVPPEKGRSYMVAKILMMLVFIGAVVFIGLKTRKQGAPCGVGQRRKGLIERVS